MALAYIQQSVKYNLCCRCLWVLKKESEICSHLLYGLCFCSFLALFLIKAWANKKNLGYGSDGAVWQPTHFFSSYFSSSVSRNLHFEGTVDFWMLELRRQLFSVLGKNSVTKSNCRKDNFIFKSTSWLGVCSTLWWQRRLQKSEESVLKAGLLSPLKTWPQVVFIRMANSHLKEWHSGTCWTGQTLPLEFSEIP